MQNEIYHFISINPTPLLKSDYLRVGGHGKQLIFSHSAGENVN